MHCYTTDEDCPLTECPACGVSLEAEGSVCVVVSADTTGSYFHTCLDPRGGLRDRYYLVARGIRLESRCSRCGESLTPYENTEKGQ